MERVPVMAAVKAAVVAIALAGVSWRCLCTGSRFVYVSKAVFETTITRASPVACSDLVILLTLVAWQDTLFPELLHWMEENRTAGALTFAAVYAVATGTPWHFLGD